MVVLRCVVYVLCLFLMVPYVDMRSFILACSGHTHLFFGHHMCYRTMIVYVNPVVNATFRIKCACLLIIHLPYDILPQV